LKSSIDVLLFVIICDTFIFKNIGPFICYF
jgi:hypothetical protein